jgi:hypothetical protein
MHIVTNVPRFGRHPFAGHQVKNVPAVRNALAFYTTIFSDLVKPTPFSLETL